MTMNSSTKDSLKILLQFSPPYIFECAINEGTVKRSGTCPYPGIMAELLESALVYANVSHHVFYHNNTSFDMPLYLDVLRNTSNSCSPPWFTLKDVPNKDVGTGKLKMTDVFHCLVRHFVFVPLGDARYDMFAFLNVFTWKAWVLMAAFMLLIRAVMSLSDQLDYNRLNINVIRSRQSIMVTAALASLLLSLYENGLLSRIIVTYEQRRFNDYTDVVRAIDSGSVKMHYIDGETWWLTEVNTGSTLQQLKAALEHNPPVAAHAEPMWQLLVTHNRTDVVALEYYPTFQYLAATRANLDAVPIQVLEPSCWRTVCNGDVPDSIIERINIALGQLDSNTQSLNTRYKRYLTALHHMHHTVQNTNKPINIQQFSGMTLILVVGIAVSLLGLTVELIW